MKIIQLFTESGEGPKKNSWRDRVCWTITHVNTKQAQECLEGQRSKMSHQACVSSVLVEALLGVLLYFDWRYLVSGFVVLQRRKKQQVHFPAQAASTLIIAAGLLSWMQSSPDPHATFRTFNVKNMFHSSLAKVAALTSGYSDFLSAQEVVTCSSSLFGLLVQRGKINPERRQPVRTSCEDPKECCTNFIFSDLLAFATWCK